MRSENSETPSGDARSPTVDTFHALTSIPVFLALKVSVSFIGTLRWFRYVGVWQLKTSVVLLLSFLCTFSVALFTGAVRRHHGRRRET